MRTYFYHPNVSWLVALLENLCRVEYPRIFSTFFPIPVAIVAIALFHKVTGFSSLKFLDLYHLELLDQQDLDIPVDETAVGKRQKRMKGELN